MEIHLAEGEWHGHSKKALILFDNRSTKRRQEGAKHLTREEGSEID